MKTKKQILDWIDENLDRYTPYRPILDCPEFEAVRKILKDLEDFILE